MFARMGRELTTLVRRSGPSAAETCVHESCSLSRSLAVDSVRAIALR
jgi:hypothetical protein